MVKFYTNAIADVLSFVGKLGQLTDSGEMANAFAAYYNLLNLKEQAGIERALLSNIFSSGHFADGQLHQLSDVVSKQNVWLAQSLRLSSPEQAAMLKNRLQSAEASKPSHFVKPRLIMSRTVDLVSILLHGSKYKPSVLK